MRIIKNNQKFIVSLLVLLSLGLLVSHCSNQGVRSSLLPDGNVPPSSNMNQMIDGATATPQTTTLSDIIDGEDETQSFIAKEILVKETFVKTVFKGLELVTMELDDLPWEKAEDFFNEIGAAAKPAFSNGSRVHVYSTKSVSNLRYLNVGFDVDMENKSIGESYIAFEVEKFNGNFETVVRYLKDSVLGSDAEPCLDNKMDQVFFQKDGLLYEVFKETTDTIELDSIYPPRSMGDVGVVKVSISKGSHNHLGGSSCFPHEARDYDHEEH